MAVVNPCIVCKKRVKDSQLGIFCDICQQWVHLSCTNLHRSEYTRLASTPDEWFCHLCLADIFPFNHLDDLDYLHCIFNLGHSNTFDANWAHSASQLNLVNKFCAVDDNIDPDKNFIKPHCKRVKYWMQEELNDYVKLNGLQDDNFSMLHINACSLNNKMDDITNFVHRFKNKFTTIVVTETWITPESPNIDLPGYKSFIINRLNKRGGGVAIYVNDALCSVARNDLIAGQKSNTDIACVQISHRNSKMIVVGLYRPPNTDTKEFNSMYSQLLENISKEKCNYYVAGDFNIDLLNYENHADTNEFLDTAMSNFSYPTITRPTRLGKSSSTLIDNIFVNNINLDCFSGIIINDLSDHLPIFYISSEKIHEATKIERRLSMYREINPVSLSKFQTKISATNWENVISSTNCADTAYNKFIDSFLSIYNECFPINTKIQKTVYNASKPWLSSGILKSIRRKEALYKRWLQKRTDISHAKYKSYKNKLTQVMRVAKKVYYKSLFADVKGDLRKTWSVIKTVINNGCDKSNSPSELLVDGKRITDMYTITNKFNKYFVNIGRDLAAKIPECDGSFESFLNDSLPQNGDSMLIEPTSAHEILNVVSELRSNKAAGFDEIAPRVVKSVVANIAVALCHLFNLSFQTGIFPDKLKIAKVTPLFKSDDKKSVSNYRPISVLPVFSKILEKLMHKRLFDFLDKRCSLSSAQFGFRSKHSTAMAIINMIDRVTEELDKKNKCIGIFYRFIKSF